jgi:hypothetical protein
LKRHEECRQEVEGAFVCEPTGTSAAIGIPVFAFLALAPLVTIFVLARRLQRGG